jgi:phenylalanyl-tRNA synthetase beta chain
MKFTLSWLKDHLDTDASLDQIAEKLTDLGLEVEGVKDPAETFAPFKVAYVEQAEPHPDADRLRVCIVDTGEEKIQVVCGAPNARTGMKGVFAPAGAYVPGTDLLLKKGKIRGQDSNGMLVSEREMGLSDDHEGIIDLPEDTPVGTPFAQLYNMDDPVIEIALTPDRADCAGVRGIARDLAAAGLGTLKELNTSAVPSNGEQGPIGVHIKAKEQCPLFLGRLVRNIENQTSPAWMQSRLKAVGLRPISVLVDITNYVTLDLCRPLHVYDADKVKGDITVRLSKDGETFNALNDKTYTLKDGMTAITDESGLLGLGGIVGGTSTGVEDDVKNVFIECAYFDPMAIARTGRDLQVESDARYRFERGVDPAFLDEAMEIATRLIVEICGSDASDVFDVVKAGEQPDWQRTIPFDPAYTKKLAGIDIPAEQQRDILTRLGFTLDGENASVPSWRADVEGKADLVEEVIRVHGYDKIEAVSVRSDMSYGAAAEIPAVARKRLARTALAGRGLSECVTWSFMGKDSAKAFEGGADGLSLSNPISADWDQMRPSILPNLIAAANQNADKGLGDTALFEVGPTFRTSKVDGQQAMAAGIRYGAPGPRHWSADNTARASDVFDAKADAQAALEAAGVQTANLQVSRDAPSYFHPGRSACLRQGKNVLAQFGEIHPAILDDMGIRALVVGFEIFLDNIPESRKKGSAKPLLSLSPFQPLSRDFAFIVDENVESDTLARAAKGADRNLITDVSVFDVYQGKGVEDGKKSVALAVTIQPVKQTLTDSEIDGICQRIVDAVSSKTGASLRG